MASDTRSVTGLTGRYATALFELADEQGSLDAVADDLKTLDTLVEECEDLNRMIRSPVISRAEQSAAMSAVLDKTDACDLTKKFVGLTIRNRRLFALKNIIVGYLTILASHRGELTAEVISASPLKHQHTAELLRVLKQSVGGNVTLNAKVDADLLGGLIVKIGSKMVDSSLRTKLQQLRLAIRGVG